MEPLFEPEMAMGVDWRVARARPEQGWMREERRARPYI